MSTPEQNDLFELLKIPYTREAYIEFTWMGEPPDPWTVEEELDLPPSLQDLSLFEEKGGKVELRS